VVERFLSEKGKEVPTSRREGKVKVSRKKIRGRFAALHSGFEGGGKGTHQNHWKSPLCFLKCGNLRKEIKLLIQKKYPTERKRKEEEKSPPASFPFTLSPEDEREVFLPRQEKTGHMQNGLPSISSEERSSQPRSDSNPIPREKKKLLLRLSDSPHVPP